MSDYIKPYSDIFIKYLFGSETNKALLLSFINAVLAESELAKIVEVEIRNPFNPKNFIIDKESILDVKAVDESGKIYNIEVQVEEDDNFKHRSLYYWARVYANQLKKGEDYTFLEPVICINILHFDLLEELPNYYNCFFLQEKNTHLVLTDHQVISFIELPKLNNVNKNKELDKFAYFLKQEGLEDNMLKTLIKDDPVIKEAHTQYQHFTEDETMRDLYEARLKWERDTNTRINSALEKGKREGKREGKIEGKIEDAKKMLKKGLSLEDITEITGLSSDEIKKLAET